MPKLYTDWHDLNDDLLKTDIPTIDGKRERFKTVIFEVDQIHYDPSIPILSDSQLERWLKSKHQRTRERDTSEAIRNVPRNDAIVVSESSKSSDVEEDSSGSSGSSSSSSEDSSGSSEDSSESSKVSSDSSDVRGKVRSEPINNDCNLRNVSEGQTSESLNSIGGLVNGHTCITLDTSDDDEEENESDAHIHSMWKSATDELVIREEIDDEFKRFLDDDDEVESEMTKNLKKIRSEPPIAKQPPPPNVSKPSVTTKSPIVTKTPSVVQPPDAVKESVPPPAPALPDWPNTEKSLKANNFYFVYRDLAHFKKHIPTSSEAIKLCQESVIKCCQEDETNYLRQIIELMFELELPDIDVWAELVPRIKRKLSPGTRFKTKVDSKIIFQNYETILVSVREHAAVKNLILKLPFGTMQWFIGYNNKPEQRLEQKPDTTQLLPLQTSGRFIVNLPDLKPKTIKIEPKNVDPDRKVTMINNEAGKTTFKITNTKKDKKPFRFRL